MKNHILKNFETNFEKFRNQKDHDASCPDLEQAPILNRDPEKTKARYLTDRSEGYKTGKPRLMIRCRYQIPHTTPDEIMIFMGCSMLACFMLFRVFKRGKDTPFRGALMI